MNKTKMFLK